IKLLMDNIENNNFNSFKELFEFTFSINFLNKNYCTMYMKDNISILSRDYFYPIGNKKNENMFTENTICINNFRRISFKEKIKINIFKKYGATTSRYLETFFNIIRQAISNKKYSFKRKLKINDISNKEQTIACNKAIENINNNNYNDYIVFYNPRWMGVTSATKELFKNLVPLQEISNINDVNNLAKNIIKNNIKQVIFSAFTDGWDLLAKTLKSLDKNIKIKCYYHGSHSQVIEYLNWKYNTDMINLHKEGIIDTIATCKESLMNFYISQKYNAVFIKNTVNLNEDILKNIKNNNSNSNLNKIGIYAAGSDWRKNTYTQFAAASLIKNFNIETVGINYDIELFANVHKFNIFGSKSKINRNELLKKMSENEINLYVTFSECAPMLPIESLEVGTICITGDNHHYFTNTPLEKYLVVKREDDVMEIYNKIIFALENKDEILKLYKMWKIDYDISSKQSVKNFLEI
ncbi:MAG: hypothetical protein RSC92_03050, partial [Clostridia bacterium]